ncbi:hypothetical protein FTUN_3350 [Frigoriglobus tundricola]|uniref:Uncharacterized protein n=1 Tax=Frigoriglobus tundricola TaxID=2774151 RepID=A0A6M5YR25_9BACT|nr:hypothetical protein FTUN_3350 [Frigoriglobus tundricola]
MSPPGSFNVPELAGGFLGWVAVSDSDGYGM